MKYKIIVSILLLCLVVSLGFDVYYYLAMMDKQAMINNMRGESIMAWARGMGSAGYLLKNATTNIDMYGVFWLFWTAADIAEAVMQHQWNPELYWRMYFASNDIRDNLAPYCEGAPTTLQYINSTAIEMLGNLTEKIWHVTSLIHNVDIDLENLEGADPIQLLEKKGILDDIIDGCIDIRNYSQQIYDFNPKFL